MATIKDWANKGKSKDDEEVEDPELSERNEDELDEEGQEPSQEDMPEDEEDTGISEEEYEEVLGLVRSSLPDIEDSIKQFDQEVLTNADEELPEEDADMLLEDLNNMDQELSDDLSGIDERTCMKIAREVEEDLEDVEPAVLAAWLYRAGELV
jgi:hypothetical protein